MKSIIEILGGAQLLLDIDFNQSKIFEEVLPEEHKAFIALLQTWITHTEAPTGTRLAAGVFNGYIYTLTDCGIT